MYRLRTLAHVSPRSGYVKQWRRFEYRDITQTGKIGLALVFRSDVEGAAAELRRAARDFETCGALRHRDEAERELRKLGHHIHRRTRSGKADGTGIDSLTEREEQVARLVVDRKTNPEIAADLFLSQKTVETHLRNIFRKVGVSSRVELARAVESAERARESAARG